MEVKYIDHMGDDLRVVNAARVSFDKESEWIHLQPKNSIWYEEDKIISEKDQKLIQYLAKHNHWTPFSHVVITLREKVPIFVARQRFKHMVGFTYNEVSRRYVDDAPEFFTPSEWRGKPVNAKQGSSDEVITDIPTFCTVSDVDGKVLSKHWSEFTIPIDQAYKNALNACEAVYEAMIKQGVAPEQARMVLPQSMYTEYYCTGSLAAWARAYKLRIDPHAQKEIRDLAVEWEKVIGGIKELEHSWKALTDV